MKNLGHYGEIRNRCRFLESPELLRKNKNAPVFCKAIDNHRLFKVGFKHHVTPYCESL